MSVEAKKAKQVVIDEIKERFEQAQSVVVVDYLGLTVAEADEMRKNLREGGVSFTVYKNTLVKRAIEGTPYEALGEALKEHRLRCQMTQEFVAESVGVSRQAVSKWERGDSDPSTSNLLALAKLFGVSAEELLRNVASTGEETDAE